uniref:Uncharacterized protein n=2 Tax=Clastoptera arizonana TaxID=38151 RepID=A0A1B6CKH6_9HEMI
MKNGNFLPLKIPINEQIKFYGILYVLEKKCSDSKNNVIDNVLSCNSKECEVVKNICLNQYLPQSRDYVVYDRRTNFKYLDNVKNKTNVENYFCNKVVNFEESMLAEEEYKVKRCIPTTLSRVSEFSNNGSSRTPKKDKRDYNWIISTHWPQILLAKYPKLPDLLSDSSNMTLFNDVPDSENAYGFAGPDVLFPDDIDYLQYEQPTYVVTPSKPNIYPKLTPNSRLSTTHVRPFPDNKGSTENLRNPSLNANVPEFYPVSRRNYFPSPYDLNYVNELFPYLKESQNLNIMSPTTYNMNDEVRNSIPVYQRPPEFYYRSESMAYSKRKNMGADFNNLIFLTQDQNCATGSNLTAMPMQPFVPLQVIQNTNQHFCNQFPQLPRQADKTNFKQKEPYEMMLEQVNQWLEKVYPVHPYSCTNISSTRNQVKHPTDIFPNTTNSSEIIQDFIEPTSGKPPTKRRLYRDVLTNSESCDMESKFEELEQEALEQYDGSHTSLIFLSNKEFNDDNTTKEYENSEPEVKYEDTVNTNIVKPIYMNLDIPVVRAPSPTPPSSDRESSLSFSSSTSPIKFSEDTKTTISRPTIRNAIDTDLIQVF